MNENKELMEFLRNLRETLTELTDDVDVELRDVDNIDLSDDIYKTVVSKLDAALNGCDELINEIEAGSYSREDFYEEEKDFFEEDDL
jgi:hypothetical protein